MRPTPHHSPRRPGFTLVETIASMVILATIAGIAAPLILQAGDGYADAATTGQLHVEASVAMDRLARSLRSVEQDTGASSASPLIASVGSGSISWGASSSVTLTGDQLILVANGGSPAVLLDDVAAFQVRTYDESNAALATTLSGTACRAIRRVEFTITCTRQGISHTLRTRVFTRAAAEGSGP